MSDQTPNTPPPGTPTLPPPPRPPRDIVVSIIMVLIGLILLLPGVCAIVFAGAIGRDPGLIALWFICIMISIGGIVMIAKAFR